MDLGPRLNWCAGSDAIGQVWPATCADPRKTRPRDAVQAPKRAILLPEGRQPAIHPGGFGYNEVHPHKALGYRSPREFIATRSTP